MKRRILAWILALTAIVASICLSSCDRNDVSEDIPADTSENTAEITDDILPDTTEKAEEATTEAPEVTEAPIIVANFKLTEDVKIVYPDGCSKDVKTAAQMIADKILSVYGLKLEICSDKTAASGPEILVGNCTARESSVDFNFEFYSNGLGFRVLSENEIAVSSNNESNISAAATGFIHNLIRVGSEPEFKVGTEYFKNNKRPDVNYIVNGVKIEEYTIVASDEYIGAAKEFAKRAKQVLCTNLTIVSAENFSGGHAIVIGDKGCNSYDGTRFRIMSETENGKSTVYIDGDSDAVLSRAVNYLFTNYLKTSTDSGEFTLPSNTYCYVFDKYDSTGLTFTEIVEQEVLYEGVDYYQMKYTNESGKNVDAFILVVSGSSPVEFRSWAGDLTHVDAGKAVFDVKTLATQAKEFESVVGEKVIAATNASYFMMGAGTNHPWTMRVIQGVELCPPRDTGNIIRPANWMGITYDGQLVTGNAETYYSTWKGKLEYALACGIYMMKDGKVQFQDDQNIEVNPLTAVATTADGGFILLCVDGRPNNGKGTSAGGTSADMLGIILDLDMLYPDIEFVDVYTMDGGGSTEMVIKDENGKFVTMNDPCNVKNGKRGNSRGIGDIIAIVIPD